MPSDTDKRLLSRADLAAVAVAIALPSLVTWAYFYQAESAAAGVQVGVYSVVKALQFAFPLAWVIWGQRGSWTIRPPHGRGVATGLAFGTLVAVAGWIIYDRLLAGSELMAPAAEEIRNKIAGWGIEYAWQYVLLGLFYSLCHSLLEEYYWRWFVFGQLSRVMSFRGAVVLSSLGFMAHHVLVLGKFFGFDHWAAWAFSACVALGGAFWAWLYARTGSLLGPWLSHAIVDAGIFLIGGRLVSDILR